MTQKQTTSTLAVVGSRSFKNYELLSDELNTLAKTDFKFDSIVSGGALGADTLAEKYAKHHDIKMNILKPDWKKHGKKAGILRNKDIVDSCNYVIAFWDGSSVGTKHSINYARIQEKPVKIVNF
jgi:hypothetical protein